MLSALFVGDQHIVYLIMYSIGTEKDAVSFVYCILRLYAKLFLNTLFIAVLLNIFDTRLLLS